MLSAIGDHSTMNSFARSIFMALMVWPVAIVTAEKSPRLGPDRPMAERVEDLLSRMTLAEKASQLVSAPPAIPRLGIPAFNWDNEGKHAFVSAFPVSIGLAASWNPQLTHQVADAIADEARATNNENVRQGKPQRYLCFWAPTVNLARDPRWGRVNESFGEDPFLTSRLSVAFIKGMQGEDAHHLKAVAGVNHFAVYSEERDRHSVDAILPDERLLRDYYLPHFEVSVREGKAAAVGASNNGLNGVPLCVNRFLLSNILRQEWGFGGFVFSDSASVEDIYQLRRLAPDGPAASAMTIRAGCEINTGLAQTHLRFLPESVHRGLLSDAEVTEACRRALTVQFRLGLYDPPSQVPYTKISKEVLDSPAHRQLALEAARESIVLLKNDESLLPLDLRKLKRIVVAGPRADKPELGRKQFGSSARTVSALDGIQTKAASAGVEVVYEKELRASVAAAETAAVVLFFTSVQEGEVADRMNLELAPRQEEHLLALTKTGKPVVVVLVSSGCVFMERWVDRVPALLAAWYPGEEGGNAIADVLFGNVNPSGKLPVTFYRNQQQLLPFEEFDIRKGHTYLYTKAPVQWPFGHGLSYTTFRYSNLRITSDSTKPGYVTVQAQVANTGHRAGSEVAQLYLHAQNRSTGDQPIQQLRGLSKITLQPGEVRAVTWELKPEDLAFHDAGINFVVEPGDYELRVGGSSANDGLRGSFSVAEKVTLRRAAEFRYAKLAVAQKTFLPNEPIPVEVEVQNIGQTTGTPQLLVDGKPFAGDAPPVGPGENNRLVVNVRLHQPGEHRLGFGSLPPVVITVEPRPANIICQRFDAPLTAVVGENYTVQAEVQNIGGECGVLEVPLLINGVRKGTRKVDLAPGANITVTLNHKFSQPGTYQLAVCDQTARFVQVGGTLASSLRTFANSAVAEFHQSSPQDFFIRATGSVGGSWVEENSGAQATWDAYASAYIPAGAKSQCVVTVKIKSLELVSNHTKAGIMFRNAINRPGDSDGYLLSGINGYYGGIGNIEWDADRDGYLEAHASYDPGGYPKFIKIEKNGRTFRTFSSSDQGETWRLRHTVELPSAAEVQDVGLFVASDSEERAALVQFADFTVEEGLFTGKIVMANTGNQPKPEQPY